MASVRATGLEKLCQLVRPLAGHLPPWSGRYRFAREVAARYQEVLLTKPDCPPGRNLLIAVPHFWPSVGGLEHRVEQFTAELVRAGYQVTVITPDFPGRTGDSRNGARIISVSPGLRVDGFPAWPYLVRKSVLSGHFDACLLIQDPLGELLWSVEQVVPPPGTKLIIQPIINAEGYAKWRDDAGFSGRLAALLKGATVAVAMTRTGPDTHFMVEAGIAHSYIPNASVVPEAAAGFRRRYGISENSFMVLHVANLWWIKNHIGLLNALDPLPDNFKLVLVGSPTAEKDCAQALFGRLAQRPEVLYVPGLSREDVSSAMEEADVIVLSSFGEGSPNTILEAMAHCKPWLATPDCGAANDNAGGIISPLTEFNDHLVALQRNPELGRRLGAVGHRHWQSCFSWNRVTRGWINLLEEGQGTEGFAMPGEIADEMARLKSLIAEAIKDRELAIDPSAELPAAEASPVLESYGPTRALVNIGMVTYNRLEFTRQAVAALQSVDPGCRFFLTVIDNASSDGTQEYLEELKCGGVINNLILLDQNVGVAKASNLAWSLVPEADYYLKLDNDIVVQKPLWLGNMVKVCHLLPDAGAVAYNFEPTSYPLVDLHGVLVRPKLKENLGGACIMISRQTHERLGFWCEDYGLYGEEDADYGTRIRCAALLNIYMEDEEVGVHLPSGRAASIDVAYNARDGMEESLHAQYRDWKDDCRRSNMLSGKVELNVSRYLQGGHRLYHGSPFVEKWRESRQEAATSGCASPAAVAAGEESESSPGDFGNLTLSRLLNEEDVKLYYLIRNGVYKDRFIHFKGAVLLTPHMLLILTALILSTVITCRYRRLYIVLHGIFMGWRGELGLHPRYLLEG
jgi:glycosyltransferase involved in cell wall biosynthesis